MSTATTLPSVITRFEDLDLTRRYTYADYITWKFEERVELFRGWVSRMAGPNMYHQKVSIDLAHSLKGIFDPKGCEVYVAPTDVLLSLSELGDTVVQPDLFVVCDLSRIKEQYYEGPPDWIIEIATPQQGPSASGASPLCRGNSKKELDKKYTYYEEAGVREYWVLYPLEKTILRFVLNEEGIYIGLAPRSVDSKRSTVPSSKV